MTTKYISPTTRIIWLALHGMLMDSGINPQSTETYDVIDDSDNWF